MARLDTADLMAPARYGSIVPPWSNVLSWRETRRYQVVLTLSCGHQAIRMKRTHRIYRRVQCEDCVEAIPTRPLPPSAPKVEVKVVIRPDIRARFRAMLARVDARLDANAKAAKRMQFAPAVTDDFGLNEYAVHLQGSSDGRIMPRWPSSPDDRS